MKTYLISISADNQWGAEWGKRRFLDNDGVYKLYKGLDQLNALLESELDLNSNEFLKAVKSEIKKLIKISVCKSAYKEKLKLLNDANFKFVIVNNVGSHGTSVYQKGIELVNCNEFAHVDEINTPEDIDGLNQMNRLYMCPKELSKSTFINYNFPSKKREIDLNF